MEEVSGHRWKWLRKPVCLPQTWRGVLSPTDASDESGWTTGNSGSPHHWQVLSFISFSLHASPV